MNEFAYPIGFKFDIGGNEVEIFSRYVSADRSNWYVIDNSVIRVMISEAELTDIIKKAKKKEVKGPGKEQTFAKAELISFVQYVTECEGQFDTSFKNWLKQNNQKKDPEYQEFLRLKEKFGE